MGAYNIMNVLRALQRDEAAGYAKAHGDDDEESLKQEVKDDLQYYYVTPLSIGVSDCFDEMVVQIPKNTTIPTKKFETISTTTFDNQDGTVISFYQGERKRASDNKLIGTLTFKGIPPAPRGVPKITVCVDIDAKGNLNVSAEDKSTGREVTMSIPGVGVEGKLLSRVEVEEMARQGEKHKSDDDEFLRKVKVVKAMKEYTIVIRENAAAGAYSEKAHDAFMDAVGKMLDEFKEKAKDFGLEGDKKMCKT
ncbi:unnamed protein product [Linum tenue]|uniref:Uncharacterized protein n=1 Tax=Linum tenue TaxID=586396 RepID=A0AAV0II47_9ROSI|nr:unnamed protein product [Linum tenue]